MKKKILKLLKILFVALLTLAVAAYLIIAMTSMTTPDPEEVCVEVILNIEENPKSNFISKSDITSLLVKRKLYPKGKKMTEINTRLIETYLKQNKFIESVDCYKSASNKFCITIKQRTPSVYVVPNNNSGFFVDRNGVVIPNTIYKTNLVIATGDIDQTYATKELLPFANLIQDNDFWDNQIEQIHVTRNAENKRVIELVPRVGNHIVHMGSVSNYEKKLKRLKTFYDKAIGTVGWNKYETINIQYDNQIICTKHKN
jgi:cell division protein FtsQ